MSTDKTNINPADLSDDKVKDPGSSDAPEGIALGIHFGDDFLPFEPEQNISDIMTNLADKEYSPTLYRETVIRQMMSVLISRDKPNSCL